MIRIIDHEGKGHGALAEITRKKGVNGEKSLTGVIYTNEEVLNGIDRGWKIEFENELYAFTYALPKDLGNKIEVDFDAVHEFFYDMEKSSQNELLSDGSHTFKTYLDFIFNGTDYNYTLDTEVNAFSKESFGQKNRLALFYDVIDQAGVEFSVNGSVVRILDRVGNDLSTIVKKGFNLNELRLEKTIGNFVTYQKGFGAWNDDEDHSKGRLEVEYLSPLAEEYGRLDADPVVDERYTNKKSLENRLKSNVEGSYQISVQIDMEDLTRAGYEYKQPHEGDSIMAINDDLGFQKKVRIVSYETDFDVEGNVLDHRITCNSIGMVDKSIMGNASLKSAVKQLETDVELTRKQVTEALVSSDGKSMNYYGPVEPTEEDYKLRIGDTWFDTSGEDTQIKVWNGVEWRRADLDKEALDRQFQELEDEIESAKQSADEAVGQIDTAVANAGFTSLDETISSVQAISNQAQINAGTAIDNALEAMQQASQAVDNTGSLNIRVDEVENTLSVKADKQTVADLTGVVDTQALDIKANADGLALKANQDTVDLIDGRVSSLGTEVNAVAGQISNKVWNTDIETAIDDIEVGGRNLLLNTAMNNSDNWTISNANSINYNEGIEFISNGTYVFLNQSFTLKKGVPYVLSGYFTATNKSLINWFGGANRGNILPQGNYDKHRFAYKYTPNEDLFFRLNVYDSSGGKEVSRIEKLKLEKGNKATDWTPAPEDTDAKIEYVESEFTQRADSIEGNIASVDGRVTSVRQDLDSVTTTVSDNEGKIVQIETNINGLQSTVADKASQTQVTQLANGFNILVNGLKDNKNMIPYWEVGGLVAADGRDYNVTDRIRTPMIKKRHSGDHTYRFSLDGVQTNASYIMRYYADGRHYDTTNGSNRVTLTDVVPYCRITITTGTTTPLNRKYQLESGSVTAYVPFNSDVSSSQLSILEDNINLRVTKGDVLGQINVEAGRTLIENDKVLISANTVAISGTAFIDGAVIKNASMDGAKIQDATISHGKIASLDASKITTGKIEGIEMDFKVGRIAGWHIRGGRFDYLTDYGYTVFKPTGDVVLASGVPESEVGVATSNATMQLFHEGMVLFNSGQGMRLGGLRRHSNEFIREGMSSQDVKYVELSSTYRLLVGERTRRVNGMYIVGYEADTNTRTTIGTDIGGDNEKKIDFVHFRSSLDIVSSGDVKVFAGRNGENRTRFEGDVVPNKSDEYHLGTNTYLWKSVRGTAIREGSDARLKKNIEPLSDEFIEHFYHELQPRKYLMDDKINYGYIAQDVQSALFKFERKYDKTARGIKNLIDKYDIVEMTDEGYLTLQYSQIEVLKGAYRDKRIEELEQRIKELENAS